MTRFSDATYIEEDWDLVRFRASDADAVVSAELARFLSLDDRGRDEYRRSVTDDDRSVLSLFSVRRSLSALRTNSLAAALEAVDARLVFNGSQPSGPSSEMKFALYAVRTLGTDPATLEERFRTLATPRAAHEFETAVEALERATSVRQTGFLETKTSNGLGVLMLPTVEVAQEYGWWGRAPVLHSNDTEFDPTENLPAIAVQLAEAFERSDGWQARPIAISVLAGSWFDELSVGSFIEATGCLGFSLGHNDFEFDPIEVWVAELPDGEVAADYVAAAQSSEETRDTTLAVGNDRLLVLLSATPTFDDVDDDTGESTSDHPAPIDLSVFEPTVRDVLNQSAR